jgi:transcriptional regulator with XRE-family HTH domain
MKMYKIVMTKRKALGLTQTELANLAGVSDATISNFELGKEVSIPVFNSIKMAIDNEFNKLDKLEYLEAMLTAHNMQLFEMDNTDEKLRCLSYMITYIGKMQLELLRD